MHRAKQDHGYIKIRKKISLTVLSIDLHIVFIFLENVKVMRIFAIEAGDLLNSVKLQYFFIFNKFLLYFTSKTCYSS